MSTRAVGTYSQGRGLCLTVDHVSQPSISVCEGLHPVLLKVETLSHFRDYIIVFGGKCEYT